MFEQMQQLFKDLSNGKEPIRGINPDETDAYGGDFMPPDQLHAHVPVALLGCFFE